MTFKKAVIQTEKMVFELFVNNEGGYPIVTSASHPNQRMLVFGLVNNPKRDLTKMDLFVEFKTFERLFVEKGAIGAYLVYAPGGLRTCSDKIVDCEVN